MKLLSVAILIASSFALVDFKIGPLKGKCNGNQMMTKENCEDFGNSPGRIWRGTFNRDWWQAGCSMTADASGKSNVYWNRHTGNRFGSSSAKPVCKTGPGCVGMSSGMRYPNDPQSDFGFYQPQTLCHKDSDCCNHGLHEKVGYGVLTDIMCSDDGFCIDYNSQEMDEAVGDEESALAAAKICYTGPGRQYRFICQQQCSRCYNGYYKGFLGVYYCCTKYDKGCTCYTGEESHASMEINEALDMEMAVGMATSCPAQGTWVDSGFTTSDRMQGMDAINTCRSPLVMAEVKLRVDKGKIYVCCIPRSAAVGIQGALGDEVLIVDAPPALGAQKLVVNGLAFVGLAGVVFAGVKVAMAKDKSFQQL